MNRDNFLTILAVVTSWFQSILGIMAVLVIFDHLVLKRIVGKKIYKSSKLTNKKSIIRLYMYSILDLVGMGTFLNKKFGLFKI